MADLRLGVALVFATALILACGDGDGPSATPTPAPTVEPSPTTGPDVTTLGDPGLTVQNVVQACREKDVGLLQSYIAVDVPFSDVATMFARGSDVQLVSQTVPDETEGVATVTVRLRVTGDDGTVEVEREWELIRGDDALWRLTRLPECF